jgi:hypothetical protein
MSNKLEMKRTNGREQELLHKIASICDEQEQEQELRTKELWDTIMSNCNEQELWIKEVQQSQEECANLRGIIANLESKLKVETDRAQDMDMKSLVKIQKLEETIQNLLIENKR